MPRAKGDGLYFKDFEKLVFGDELLNQASIYHDGASIVFENITISGAEGPPGPSGAGVPGNLITNESGATGITVSDSEYIDFFRGSEGRILIGIGATAVGVNPSFPHNWGTFIVKTEVDTTLGQDGLVIGHFGETGYPVMEFLRSHGTSLNPGPSQTGDWLGALQFNSLNYNELGITPYVRIYALDELATPSTNTHNVSLFLQTKNDAGAWLTNLKLIGGADGGIQLMNGQIVNTIALDTTEIDENAYDSSNTLLTAFGVEQSISNFRTEVNAMFTSISGAEYWEMFDSTISGSRIECNYNAFDLSTIDFKINNDVVGGFNNSGAFTLGKNTVPSKPLIMGIVSNTSLNDTGYGGDTLATTQAIKTFVIETGRAGAGGNYLTTPLGAIATVTDTSFLFTSLNGYTQGFHDISRFSAGGVLQSSTLHWINNPGDPGGMYNYVATYAGHGYGYGGPNDDLLNEGWINTQWHGRIFNNQKHSLFVGNLQTPSIAIAGWSGNSNGWLWGPQLAFINHGGTPGSPTHLYKNSVIGRIVWDYPAYDGSKELDRGAWIEVRKGPTNYSEGTTWQGTGIYVPPSAGPDYHSLENEMIIAASPYLHLGRIRLRSRLFFDDGSNNFVSGIIQAENSAVQGAAAVTNPLNDPWGRSVPKQWAWGMDHVIPTAQWVLNRIAADTAIVVDQSTTPYWRTTNDSYNYSDDHAAGLGQGGFTVHTGWTPGDLVFTVGGRPGFLGMTADRKTWAMRLLSRSNSSRFFIENYSTATSTSTNTWTTDTGRLCFYRARGGDGMLAAKAYGAALDTTIAANNNGACVAGNILGEIEAYGQAPANGLDRDPCAFWAWYQPACKISFRAEVVNQTTIEGGIYFQTAGLSPGSSWDINVHGICSSRGNWVFGKPTYGVWGLEVSDGTATYASKIYNMTYGAVGTITNEGYRWSTEAAGEEHPHGGFVITGQRTEGSLGGAGIRYTRSWINKFNIRGGMFYEDYLAPLVLGTAELVSNVGGLVFKSYDPGLKCALGRMNLTEGGRLVLGYDIRTHGTDTYGLFVVRPFAGDLANSNNGIVIQHPTTPTKMLKSFLAVADGYPGINSASGGTDPLTINEGVGIVQLGNPAVEVDADLIKLKVAGCITPSVDNRYDLGQSDLRWDDIWATNGTIQVSDARTKHEIKKGYLGMAFIRSLSSVAYRRSGGKRQHHGLIAQDVEAVLTKMGKPTSEFAGLIHDAKTDVYGLRYEEFIAPMIKAIQELADEVTELKAQLNKPKRSKGVK